MRQRSGSFYGVMILVESLLLGVGNPVAKYGMSSFPFFMFVAIRFLLGSLFLVIVFHKQIKKGLKKSFWIPGTVIGAFTAAAYITGTMSFKYTTATNAGFLFALPVVFTPFLMRVVSRTKVDRKKYLPIIIVICGLYFLCCKGGGFRIGVGELLAILSSFLIACVFEFSSGFMDKMDPLLLAAYQAGFTGVVCLTLSMINGERMPALSGIPVSAWSALLYLAVGCTGIGYCLQNSALSRIDSTKAALVLCSQPIFTAAASFVMLGERMSWIEVVGAVIIMGGILWASVMPDAKQEKPSGQIDDSACQTADGDY